MTLDVILSHSLSRLDVGKARREELKPKRSPPEWWAAWQADKHAHLRTSGTAYDANTSNLYAACVSRSLPPIHPQSTFHFRSVQEGQTRFSGASMNQERPFARVYTRLGNPTTEALETVIHDLECGYGDRPSPDVINGAAAKPQRHHPIVGTLITSSGMGAISTVLLALLAAGDHIICGTVYGCTHSLMMKLQKQYGIHVHFADTTNLDAVAALLEEHDIRAVYVESVENPTMRVNDLEGLAALTEPLAIPLIVDNTFATPYNTQPFRLGADIVVHSTTKYMNGHSTAVGGALLGPWGFVMGEGFGWYKDLGATPSAFDCWVNLQNLQDFPLRMERQCMSAAQVAAFLEKHESVERVWYPSLKTHAQFDLSRAQMRTGGGMIAFEVKGGYDAAVRLMDYFAAASPQRDDNGDVDAAQVHLCVSLGSVSTYIQHPASMTHACIPKPQRQAMGITDTLVRVSIGVDDVATIVNAFKRGFKEMSKPIECQPEP